MNFTSAAFLLCFPAVVVLHWLLPHRLRWVLLLAVSYLFYMGHTPALALLLAGTTLASYLAGLGLKRRPRLRGLWLALGAGVPLLALALFKYGDFLLACVGSGRTLGLILPVGISFYTFQTLSYVLDVDAGRIPAEEHLGYYALFVSFFPQLVAGPIERPEHLLPQLRRERSFQGDDLWTGLSLMAEGFFRKLALSDVLAQTADPVFQAQKPVSGFAVALGCVCFALQIYCDFSGYSLIACGAARMMGVHLSENFRQPYFAESMQSFWRRWHISLTGWFSDYVYKPLGGSRAGLVRQIRNVAVVFALSGLWHGAQWHFPLWGGIHALYLIASILARRFLPRRSIPPWLGRLRTFALTCFAWLFFRASSLPHAARLLHSLLFCWGAGSLSSALALTGLDAGGGAVLVLGAAVLYLLDRHQADAPPQPPHRQALRCFLLTLTAVFARLLLLSGSGESAFLYFQF